MARRKREPLHTMPSRLSGAVLGGKDQRSVSPSPNSSRPRPQTHVTGTNSPSEQGASWSIAVTAGHRCATPEATSAHCIPTLQPGGQAGR